MPLSQLTLQRAAELDAVAKAGLPGPLEPVAHATRICFIALLAGVAAAGGIVACRAQWWQISYYERDLCDVNSGACSLHLQIALTWLCLETPTKRECASVKALGAEFQTEAAADRVIEGARIPLLLALALHAPLMIALLVLLLMGPCARSRQARTCGYRMVACMALMSAVLLMLVLGTFLAAVPPYFKFAQHLVGGAFGRLAMQDPKLQATPSIGSIGCVVAFAFDVALTCMAFEAGDGDALRWYPHHEVHRPPTHALHLAPFATGGPSAGAIYAAVPTSPEEGVARAQEAEFRGWRNDLKPLGRFQQWTLLPHR